MTRKKNKMFVDSAERTPHYSLRKLSVGVASVLLSTTLWMSANGSVAHADTINDVNAAGKTSNNSAEDNSDPSETQKASEDQTQSQPAEATSQASEENAEKQNTASEATQADASQAEQGQSQNVGNASDVANAVVDATQAENRQVQDNKTAQADDEAQAPASSNVQEAATQNEQDAAQAPAEGQAAEAEKQTVNDAQAADNEANEAESQDQKNDAATAPENNGNATADVENVKEDATEGKTNAGDANSLNSSVELDAKDALKMSKAATINKKMAMVRLASATKLADQYEAKGAEYTEIYGQTIDPKNLISNFSELPAGTTASAANLEAIKTKQGRNVRNVVSVTVTYSDGSTDTADAIVWVTPQGTTALAKSVTLKTYGDSSVTVPAAQSVPLEVLFSGTAVLDGSTVKKGARIFLAQVTEKYNEPCGTGKAVMPVSDEKDGIIGNLVAVKHDGNIDLYLDITTKTQYSSDVSIKFNIEASNSIYGADQAGTDYRDVYLKHTDDPYDFSGTIVQKRYLHTVGKDDQEWTINRIVPEIKEADPWNIGATNPSIDVSYSALHFGQDVLIGYAGASLNPKNVAQSTFTKASQLAKEIWASKGKNVPEGLPAKQNIHEVWQFTTPTGASINSYIASTTLWGVKQLATADGLPSNQDSRLYGDGFSIYQAPDNTSIQTLYDTTPSGKIGFSKQANGTCLICFNLTAEDFVPSAGAVTNLVNTNPAAALSANYEKILQANIDFYANNAVPDFASWFGDSFYIGLPQQSIPVTGTYVLQDVTPGSPNSYTVKASYTAGSASAGGETKSTNTYYFVDDSNNQAIIGGTHQISGGVGDTVPLNLTVPSGYVLASGQSLPTSYTFAKTNSDIIIHVVPIYKSQTLTDDVNRTINYKTTDGSNAPASKSNSLKFYGTKTTGDLSNLVNRAGQDGLTVNKGDAKEYSTKKEALADLNKQATEIQNALTKYEAEKAAYDAAKKVYDQDLTKWNASQNSEHTIKGISQSLSFNGETDADLKVSTSDKSPVNYIKSKSWLGADGKGVYTADNIAKSFGDSDISFSQAEGTATDSSGWGKTYTGVQMKTGQTVIAQYTGLKNSVYVDGNGAAHKLSKVKISYTLNSTTANDGTANVFLSNNPNIAFWYSAAAGKSDGSVDFTLDMTFYDQDGNAITLGKGSNAWLNMSSLNRNTTTTEYFNPGNNTTMEIPGSTIIKHDDGWYADSSNEANGTAWDSTTSSDRYYGAAIMELEGNSFHIGKKVDAGQGVYSWNAIDSNLATAYKPTSPVEPTKPIINWHEVSNTTWDGPKDFADVASPTVKGYTPNRKTVSNKNIAHNAADIVETVTYTPDAQKSTVTYIDDNTGTTLKTDTLTGVTNAKSGYTTKASIDTYKKAGYVLVSDSTNGIEIVYDSDDAVDQNYVVHLKHGTKIPAENRHYATVSRTITYKMSDGSKAPAGVSDSLDFTAQDTIDAVTGAVVSTAWSGNQNFADVTSPVIAGYTADKKTISNKSIAHDHANITEIVTYTPDKQTATVTYIDNTTGKTLKTDTLNGVTNAKSGYTTKSSIDGYKALGYVLTADTTNGAEVVFDTDDGANQAYTVTLAHGYQTVTNTDNIKVGSAINSNATGAKWPKGTDKASLEDSVKRTINYVIANGKKSAPASVSDSLAYTAAATVDKVTGEIVKIVWSASQNFKDVASPAVKGYTPNRASVSNTAIAHDHADITETVTYNPDKQTATVSYLDDTTGKQIRFDSLSGRTLEGSGYNTKSIISNYQDNGYVLVSDPTNGAEVVFDDDDNASQAYTVVLKHTYVTVTPDKPANPGTPINADANGAKYPEGTDKASLTDSVGRTIVYVVVGGKDAAPSQVKDSLDYSAIKSIDRVTGEVVKTEWSDAKDFDDVTSPILKGYTVDRKVVSDKNVAYDHADIVETVTYAPDKQDASVTYHDDTTGKVMKIVNLSGYTHGDSGYNTKGSIIDYIELGYDLASDSSNGAEIIFDDEDNKDQNYDVHLKHKTVTVTPEKPGNPGKAINLNPDGAKWPEGTGKASLEDDVDRTIDYVVKGGKDAAPESVRDSLHYEAAKVIDKVTGEVLSTKWDLNQDFKTVNTPAIKGYTPDKLAISNVSVAHDDPDIKEVVTYSPDAQKASVTYVDQTTGKTLKVNKLDGVTHADSGYSTKGDIKHYADLGYKLVSDDTNGAEIIFDNDDATDQIYKVVLAHDYEDVTSGMDKKTGTPINPGKGSASWPEGASNAALQHDVKRTIAYVVKGGKKPARSSVNGSLHYEAVATVDKVTGAVVKTVWSGPQSFADVASPSIKGYTVDKKIISDRNVAHDHADIAEVVTYSPDAQKASVTYVDQTTGKTLAVKNLNGHTLEDSGYKTAGDIKHYVDNGYDLTGDTSKGAEIIFDDEDGADQSYTVTFKHGVATIDENRPGKPGEPINSDKNGAKWPDGTDKAGLGHDVVRTIVYKAVDGSQVPASVKDVLHFTAKKTVDKVTGKVLDTEWSSAQDFKDVATPSIKGYTPDQKVISDKGITHEHSDINEVVTYVPDPQKASVTYYDDTEGKTLKTASLKGVTHADSGYDTKESISGYENLGYKLVSDDTKGISIVFDNDDKADQAYAVHLAHDYATVTSKMDKKTGTPINPDKNGASWPEGASKSALQHDVKRAITYVIANGKKAAPSSVNGSLHYEAVATIDKVTGEVVKTDWSAPQDFNDVASPSVKGYTADKKVISNKNVVHDHADIAELVTYSPDAQKASVTYVDQTTGKTLAVKNLNGRTLEDSEYNTVPAINAYKNLGYELASDDTKGAEIIFDDDDAADQAYKVVLVHGYEDVTSGMDKKTGTSINADKNGAKWPEGASKTALQDNVKRTVTYVIANGKKAAPSVVSDSLHYEAVATVDKVTGAVVKTVWDAPQDFKDVASPSIKGYTADKKVISNKGVAHDAKDIAEVVTYSPDAQKASVTYVDQTTGKTLAVKNLNGHTLEDSGYKTSGDIKHYFDNGYDLVSDNTNGVSVVFDDDDAADQAYKVVLAHGHAVVTSGDNVPAGSPINADKNGAKWPEGASKSALQHDVKRSINYVIANGKKAAPSAVNDSLHYEAAATVDKVTGQIVKTVWSAPQDFNDVASPSVKGYTADKKVISNKNVVHDHADIAELVTYSPDAQKASVTYVDQTTGKTLAVKNLTGHTLEDAGYKTTGDIKHYVDNGYELASDDTKGDEIFFDDDDAADQAYKVVLAHGYEDVTSGMEKKAGTPINADKNGAKWPEGASKTALQDDVNRTVTYVVKGGKKAAPAAVKDSLHYEAVATVDKVTGAVVKTVWDAPQDFKDATTPAIKGYTADKKVISNKGVAHDAKDIAEVVTYSPDAQKASVTYVDQTTGKILAVKSLNGHTLEDSGYDTKSSIAGYESLGYDLTSDSSKGAEIIFDDDDAADQVYTVAFVHGTTDVSESNPGQPGESINPGKGSAKWPEGTDKKSLGKDVTRTIVYKVVDGSQMPASVKDVLHFTAKKTVDKVTGKVLDTEWSGAQDFKDVDSPVVKGYTADKKVVSDKNVAHDAKDIKEVVTYSPDAQKAIVTYVDDTTGKTLKEDVLEGVTNAKSGYDTKSAVDAYKGLGYDLVSDDTKGAEIVFDNDDAADQSFAVHFKHGIATVTRENPGKPGESINSGKGSAKWPEGTDKKSLGKDVTRTIVYKAVDGSQVPASVKDVLHFTAKKTVDKVTGKVLDTEWSSAQDFKDVATPSIKGYTPDQKVISDKGITHEHSDINEVVTYVPDPQKASVTYYDDTEGKTLKTASLKGVTHADSGYDTKESISGYENLGYKLVSDDTKGKSVIFDSDDAKNQSYVVHFEHGTLMLGPSDGENPVTGKDDRGNLIKHVAQTIRYVDSDGNQAHKPNVQTLTFKRAELIDTVTGEVLSYTPWSGPEKTKDVENPVLPGSRTSQSMVKGSSYTADSPDKTITVVYSKSKGVDKRGTNVPQESGQKPASGSGQSRQAQSALPTEQGKTTSPAGQEGQAQAQLPQTGNDNVDEAAAAGMGLVATLAMLGYTGTKKRKREDEE